MTNKKGTSQILVVICTLTKEKVLQNMTKKQSRKSQILVVISIGISGRRCDTQEGKKPDPSGDLRTHKGKCSKTSPTKRSTKSQILVVI